MYSTYAQFFTLVAVALFHFTWMTTLIGALVWTVSHLLARFRATHHYQFLMAGLVAVLLAIPISIFFAWPAIHWVKPTQGEIGKIAEKSSSITTDLVSESSVTTNPMGMPSAELNQEFQPTAESFNLLQSATEWIVAFAPWIALVYSVGLAVMLVRLAVMLIGCQRIVRRSKPLRDSRIVEAVSRLATQMGIRVVPAVATCGRVAVPVIVGIWKPVVLLPASMSTGLSQNEIEIVICHELAHLRRLDPLVVLIQRILETVFFFHPVVWFLCASLDRQREICCDDLVLQTGTSKIAYATTLCRVAELATGKPSGLSLAATGASSAELLFRVRNILGERAIRPATSWNQALMAFTPIVLGFVICIYWIFSAGQSSLPSMLQDGIVQSENDKFEFDRSNYQEDLPEGFSVVFKLLTKAEKENAPPETLARLRFQAADMLRYIELRKRNSPEDSSPQDFSRAITILRGVCTNPDQYLVNKESAHGFANCASLLATIYQEKVGLEKEIADLINTAINDIKAAWALTDRDRLLISNQIRMTASDLALHAEDWPAAIAWVQPIIDSTDEYLKDAEGAAHLAMAARQQSMFLAENGDETESAALIDGICEKLEASTLDESEKIIHQTLLRGKHLINFDRSPNKEQQIAAGWPKYQSLAKRSRAYQGKNRAVVLRACIANMDRLAISCFKPEESDKAIELIRETMMLIESEPALQDPEFRALWSLQDMARMAGMHFRNERVATLQADVKAFVAKYEKKK